MDGEENKRHIRARFWRKLLRLTRGRVPILKALQVVEAEEKDGSFQQAVANIRRLLEQEEKSLSEALATEPRFFSLSVIELIRAAEKTGAWDEILAEIADGIEEGTFD
jgi:type II secretory pathway component PulF